VSNKMVLALGLIAVALFWSGVTIGQYAERYIQKSRHVLIIAPNGINGGRVLFEASSGETWFLGASPANCYLSAVKMQAGGGGR
jgi:hypothetical protein